MCTVRLEQVLIPQAVNIFPAFYGTLKAHFRIHNRPPSLPTLNHINQVHAFSSDFFKSHFNIILISTPRFSKWSLSFRFPHQNFVYYIYLLPAPAACPSRLIPLGLIIRIIVVIETINLVHTQDIGGGGDAEPSPPSSAVVMKGQSYTSTPPMGRTACLYRASVPVQGCTLPF
jgi:hypothetical protein